MKDFPKFGHSKGGADPASEAGGVERELHRRYLLGPMTEEEMTQVEERYFSDPDLFARLEAVEEDLVDDYVRGNLSGAERGRFEQSYLNSPQRQEKVRFARLLQQYLAEQEARAPEVAKRARAPMWLPMRFPLAAAAAIVLVGGSVSLVHLWRSRGQVSHRLAAEQARLAAERSQRERLELQLSQWDHGVVSFDLLGDVRSLGQPPRLRVPAAATRVRLVLEREGPPPPGGYRMVLQTASGEEVWSRLAPAIHPLSVSLPPEILAEGRYQLLLQAVGAGGRLEPAGAFSFSVSR